MFIKQNVLVYYSIDIYCTLKKRLSQAVGQIKSSSDVQYRLQSVCFIKIINIIMIMDY